MKFVYIQYFAPIQKQLSRDVLRKRCTENMLQIYRRIPILKCDFREHTCQSAISIKLQSKFIEITLRHGCSPVDLLYILRTLFLKNTSGWLLLPIHLRGCLHVKFHPGMKSSLSVLKCLLLFTRFCRDEISSWNERQG